MSDKLQEKVVGTSTSTPAGAKDSVKRSVAKGGATPAGAKDSTPPGAKDGTLGAKD